MRHVNTRSTRGMGLIESIISMAILGIALVGLSQLQLVAVGSNSLSRKMTQATSLGHDLVENITQWNYNDPRLAVTAALVTAFDDTAITALSSLPRVEYDAMDPKPHYTADALDTETVAYDGLDADLDGDGEADFERYWSVFDVDADGDGLSDGKYVVVIVRWREPIIGFRQVTLSTFRNNVGNFTL